MNATAGIRDQRAILRGGAGPAAGTSSHSLVRAFFTRVAGVADVARLIRIGGRERPFVVAGCGITSRPRLHFLRIASVG